MFGAAMWWRGPDLNQRPAILEALDGNPLMEGVTETRIASDAVVLVCEDEEFGSCEVYISDVWATVGGAWQFAVDYEQFDEVAV